MFKSMSFSISTPSEHSFRGVWPGASAGGGISCERANTTVSGRSISRLYLHTQQSALHRAPEVDKTRQRAFSGTLSLETPPKTCLQALRYSSLLYTFNIAVNKHEIHLHTNQNVEAAGPDVFI